MEKSTAYVDIQRVQTLISSSALEDNPPLLAFFNWLFSKAVGFSSTKDMDTAGTLIPVGSV